MHPFIVIGIGLVALGLVADQGRKKPANRTAPKPLANTVPTVQNQTGTVLEETDDDGEAASTTGRSIAGGDDSGEGAAGGGGTPGNPETVDTLTNPEE